MKFSVVIPCHDRLEQLQEAVYTVMKQDFADWSLFIFDNASKSDLAAYVRNLGDSRIFYARSDTFLSVTDSWNRAIEMATGDYIVFLGDDDGLTPNYFSRLIPLIQQFGNPELIYSAFYQFCYPEVAPWAPEGYCIEIKNGFFFVNQKNPFLLSKKQARQAVNGSLTLRRNFSYNIQAFVFSKAFLSNLKKDGPIFQSTFPDYYMANIAMAKSKSVLIIPDPMSICGISKASVGYALYNGLENRFHEILNSNLNSDAIFNEIKDIFLPGSFYDLQYVLSMEYVVRFLNSPLYPKVSFNRYRRWQIYSLLNQENHSTKILRTPLWTQLSLMEKTWGVSQLVLIKTIKFTKFLLRIKPPKFLKKIKNRFFNPSLSHSFVPLVKNLQVNYKHLTEVFDALLRNNLK